MKSGSKKSSSISGGLFWAFGERIAAQLVTTLVTIILARLLDPEHYGIISIVTVFITLCNIFVTSGYGTALVQKKEADDDDFNTAFVLSFSISLVLYIFLFFVAPYIESFYEINSLALVMRVLALRLPIASINSIQQASVQRNMKFKKFFISTSFGTIISGIVGITFAYIGFGVWALVFQYLTNVVIDTIVLLFIGDWKPRFRINKARCKYILSFGSKVLATNLVFTIENDIRSLIVGKVFGSSELAYYDQGKKYPSLLVTNVNSAISKVMLPVYSKKQEDADELKRMLRKSVKVGVYVMSPILFGFAAAAQNFTIVFLTNKWLPAVIFMQLYAISCITRPFDVACHQALLAIGKSSLVFKLMVITTLSSLISLSVAVFLFKSVIMIAILNILCAIVSYICFSIAAINYLSYTLKEQLIDILPSFVLSLLMSIIVSFIGNLNISIIVLLALQVCIGIVVYITLSATTRIDAFTIVLKMMKHHFINK